MSKQLNTEIIAVGTELLLGQIANTNAQWMSDELAQYGINTYFHTVVGDNMNRLTDVFRKAQDRANLVIVTGGLGPTQDDLSREAFQQMSDLTIVYDEKSMEKIRAFFQKQQIEMTPNNRRQARVFQDSSVLENKVGMAPGNLVEFEGVTWIFLPGVPREMKQIFRDSVIPYLTKVNGEKVLVSKILNFIGIGESVLEHELEDLISEQNNPTIAPLAVPGKITVRLTAKAEKKEEAEYLLEQTKANILERVGDYYFGEGHITIEQKVFDQLMQKEQTIASAESLTGGMFASNIVDTPGASHVLKGSVVCYDSAVKKDILHVDEKVIIDEGVVSESCAKQLAQNVRTLLKSDIGISFTGVAGPDAAEGKQAGTVFIGISTKNETSVYEYVFNGNRKQIRERSVLKGYELLHTLLK